MVSHDRELSAPHRTAVLVDVTTITGAEEFILSGNRRTPLGDPFARQAYAEC